MIEYNDNLQHIHAFDLLKLIGERSLIIIDIREPHELEESSIPNAKNIPMNTLLNNVNSILDKNTLYYILCHTGQRSYHVTKELMGQGYNATNVVGGIALMPEYYHY